MKKILIRNLVLTLISLLIALCVVCDGDKAIIVVDEPEPVLCGDINGDGSISVADFSFLADYLFIGSALPNPEAADVDGIAGITTNDNEYLLNYVYLSGDSLLCASPNVDTVLPISRDTLFIENKIVPSGDSVWQVDLYIDSDSAIDFLTLPLHYSCTTTEIECDSIKYFTLIKKANPETGVDFYGGHDMNYIDTALNKILITYSDLGAMPTKMKLAELYFSIEPNQVANTIILDTTTYLPSHVTILSRFIAPKTSALTPEIIF